MCRELGVKEYTEKRSSYIMDKRTETKDSLSEYQSGEWLECVCFMLDTFAAL